MSVEKTKKTFCSSPVILHPRQLPMLPMPWAGVVPNFKPLPNYYLLSIGRFRVRCGRGVRIRQSESDFNERGNNLAQERH